MSARRESGSGSLEVLPSGKARITFRQGGRRKRKTFPNEERAREALARLNALREAGAIAAVDSLTFGEVFGRFMDARELGGRVRGIPQERDLARARIQTAAFWEAPITSIRRNELIDWIDVLLASPALVGGRGPRRETGRTLSRETVGKAFRLVRSCFAWAVHRDLLETNPALEVRVPKHVRPEDLEDQWTFLDAEEIALLFASELSERDRALFTLAIYGGLRQGELFSLRWEDVHEAAEDRPRVVVRRGRRGPTKSKKIRDVPLLAPARAALARWRGLQGDVRPDAPVFPNRDGEHYGPKYDAGWPDKRQRRPRKKTAPVLEVTPGVKSRAGITRDVRFHDLRHTCASHLVMGTWGARWTLEEVRDFLGHSTIRMTERYAHLAADSLHARARVTRLPCPTVSHGDATQRATVEAQNDESPRDSGGLSRDGRSGSRTQDFHRVKVAL